MELEGRKRDERTRPIWSPRIVEPTWAGFADEVFRPCRRKGVHSLIHSVFEQRSVVDFCACKYNRRIQTINVCRAHSIVQATIRDVERATADSQNRIRDGAFHRPTTTSRQWRTARDLSSKLNRLANLPQQHNITTTSISGQFQPSLPAMDNRNPSSVIDLASPTLPHGTAHSLLAMDGDDDTMSSLDFSILAYSLNESHTGCFRPGALPVSLSLDADDLCLPGFHCPLNHISPNASWPPTDISGANRSELKRGTSTAVLSSD